MYVYLYVCVCACVLGGKYTAFAIMYALNAQVC